MDALRVGVDLDCTLYPFDEAMRSYVQRRHGGALTDSTLGSYCLATRWGLTPDEWNRYFREAVADGAAFGSADPYPDAVTGLEAIAAAGHTIVVVTARSIPGLESEAAGSTIEWLDKHSVPYHELIFAADKTQGRCDVFVDDHPRNVVDLEAAGVATWVYDQPYNRQLRTCRRVRSMPEFAVEVQAFTETRTLVGVG